MATVNDYGVLGSLIVHLADPLGDKELYSIEGLKKVYHDDTLGLLDEEVPYTEAIINEALNIVKDAFSVSCDNPKLDKLIYEWNENIASIIGVKCNTFEEFAEQVARVSSDWAKAVKSAEIAQQQPVQQLAPQSQSQQTFVDVNTLLSENTYLKLVNEHKDKEIDILKARLTALGQTV